MDAVNYLKERARMCKANQTGEMTCENCAAYKGVSQCYKLGEPKDPEKMVAIVEQWAAEHSIKTRQSVFLEQFPNVRLDTNEIIDISPCRVDPKQYPFNGKDCCKFRSCGECRREFWMQEVEE